MVEARSTQTHRRTSFIQSTMRARPALPRLARRYGSFVRFLKLVLPSVAALLVILIAVWPQMNPSNSQLALGFASISQQELDNLSMINARYTGIDGRNQPFAVIADVATEVSPESDLIELETPKADITLEDGTWLALTATAGTFHRENQVIQLKGEVNLFHDAGYEFRTRSARIDLQNGTAYGVDPVFGHGPFGTVKSLGFYVLDQGQRVVFTGKSRLVLYPGIKRLP